MSDNLYVVLVSMQQDHGWDLKIFNEMNVLLAANADEAIGIATRIIAKKYPLARLTGTPHPMDVSDVARGFAAGTASRGDA